MIKYNNKEKYCSPPGERFSILYSSSLDDRQRIVLKPSGKRDNRAYSNSFRESTDISFIIRRLNAGDVSAINQRNPFYADITRAPTTRADMLQLSIDCQNSFYALPADVRHQFHDNYREYMSSAGSDDWLKKLGVYATEAQAAMDSDVKEYKDAQ